MKKYVTLLWLVLITQFAVSQNIGIGTTTPHPSAMLDVTSTAKGFLTPRLFKSQRDLIASPATGLLIYQTDNTPGFYFYNGAGWVQLVGSGSSNYWSQNGNNIFNNNAGFVGIGTNNPVSLITLKNKLSEPGFTHIRDSSAEFGLDSVVVSESIGDYSASLGTTTNHQLNLTTNGLSRLQILPTGEVNISDYGTTTFGKLNVVTPNNSFGIAHFGDGGNILATRMGGVSAGIGTFSNTAMRIFCNNVSAIYVSALNQNVGLGTDNPGDKLTLVTPTSYYGLTHTDGNIALTTYVGGNRGWIGTKTNHPFSLMAYGNIGMTVTANGNIGIGTINPTNKLQIGSVGSSGFATNDLAIGNGTNAMAIYQTDNTTLIGATTDIVIKPRNNGAGRVGINTHTPRAPLDVIGNVGATSFYSYLNYGSAGPANIGWCNPCTSNATIYASNAVYASEFDAYSDARIKDIVSVSNSSKDLEMLDALEVTDYTLKDKVKNGNKPFKKVIAQQVEIVYPQVVSKHVDFIPNVYAVTSKIEKTENGYLLSFANKHNISSTAKKLQLLISEGTGLQEFDIVSRLSDYQVVIKAANLKADKAFVYGEEVDDFRTVDYEGLTTLNISATQELSKQIKKQQAAIDALIEEIKKMKEKGCRGIE